MSKHIINSIRVTFSCFFLLMIVGCNFGQDLLEPTLTTKSQWANKIGGRTYAGLDGVDIVFDLKGNIETQKYKDGVYATGTFTTYDVIKTYSVEAVVNAYTTIYKVTENRTGESERIYYIGYAVDNGAILYRTDKAINATYLVDPASVGLKEIGSISDLEDVSMDSLDNAKLRSLHMAGHRVAIESMADIKMTETKWNKYFDGLADRLFVGEFVISLPQFEADGITPSLDADGIPITNSSNTYAYLRLGAFGRMDVNYYIKTNATTGIIDASAILSEVTAEANIIPFTKENITNNAIPNKIYKNYLSTNNSMVYTTDDGVTTFISGFVAESYDEYADLQYNGYKYNYAKLRFMHDGNIELVDNSFFVPLPDVTTKPYYSLPKNIVLSNVAAFTPAP